jgi:hypothetical protein
MFLEFPHQIFASCLGFHQCIGQFEYVFIYRKILGDYNDQKNCKSSGSPNPKDH